MIYFNLNVENSLIFCIDKAEKGISKCIFASMQIQIPEVEVIHIINKASYMRILWREECKVIFCILENDLKFKKKGQIFALDIKIATFDCLLSFSLVFKSYLFPNWLKYFFYKLKSACPLWVKLGLWLASRRYFWIQNYQGIRMIKRRYFTSFDRKYQLIIQINAFEELEKNYCFSYNSSSAQSQIKERISCYQTQTSKYQRQFSDGYKNFIKGCQFFSKTLKIKQRRMAIALEEFKKALFNYTNLTFKKRNLKVFYKFKNNPNVVFLRPMKKMYQQIFQLKHMKMQYL
ncbi:unnamed protein product (macronuclear) [Paramecium tetraurelia]|uniref:Uncharacterized protein n=1 Tax=Paramecium tetraurelia TaxID=5888 RepID=A0DQE7_PARTE|nr:uncharacterized protein GSPATT00002664001 [Paramecium tetraurelia]CAK85264.1 unnamed protein product [Paramecium tetraurelia]|eukprot:XP_001452661.1 hypothetical protein (macronuclear) [Paramecium tetraurelia strain d4-2]